MNKRHYLKIQIAAYSLIVLFILSLPLWAEVKDGEGFLIAGLIALVAGFLAYRSIRQLKATDETERVYAPPADATPTEQAAYYRRFMYIGLAAFPLLTLITVWDLNGLESGAVESVSVWAPIGFLYEQFGYWAAVGSIPLLGLVVVYGLYRKSRSVGMQG